MKKILLFLFCPFILILCSFKLHPYHVGSVEFKYNSSSKTFEISGTFFLDDLENTLKEKYGKPLHFNTKEHQTQIDLYLKKYSEESLKLKTDNKALKINYLGYEENQESVNIYLESEKINPPKKVEVAVSFLYNLYGDQLNIIHLIVGGKRQSEKLTYPNRYLYKIFK